MKQYGRNTPLTQGLIENAPCKPGRDYTLYWDSQPSLGLRVTEAGHRAFIFDGRIKATGESVRITIGDVQTWDIEQARSRARDLRRLCQQSIDPRTGKKARPDEPAPEPETPADDAIPAGLSQAEYAELVGDLIDGAALAWTAGEHEETRQSLHQALRAMDLMEGKP